MSKLGLALVAIQMALGASASFAAKSDGSRRVVLKADLDGDGRRDQAVVTFMQGDEHFRVVVGKDSLVEYGESLNGTATVVDIDSTDGFREIAIPEEGPSDDYAVTFVRYSREGLRVIGKLPGIIGADEDFFRLSVDGSGTIRTTCRGSILHTWYHPCSFRFYEETEALGLVPQAFVPMNSRVQLKRDLPLFSSPVDRRIASTILRGDSATIELTDDREWCRIRSAKGASGWFWVRDWKILIGHQGVDPGEVFEGLSFAD